MGHAGPLQGTRHTPSHTHSHLGAIFLVSPTTGMLLRCSRKLHETQMNFQENEKEESQKSTQCPIMHAPDKATNII